MRKCRICGCTDNHCSVCIEKTGNPCFWIEEDLCSACQNVNALQRLENVYDTKINQLFWIAGSQSNSDLEDLLESLDEPVLSECFPTLMNSEFSEAYKEEGITIHDLIDFGLAGVFAEIYIPKCYDIGFNDKGEVSYFSSNTGISRIAYVYSESLEGLLTKIEEKAEQIFQEYINNEKKQINGI